MNHLTQPARKWASKRVKESGIFSVVHRAFIFILGRSHAKFFFFPHHNRHRGVLSCWRLESMHRLCSADQPGGLIQSAGFEQSKSLHIMHQFVQLPNTAATSYCEREFCHCVHYQPCATLALERTAAGRVTRIVCCEIEAMALADNTWPTATFQPFP